MGYQYNPEREMEVADHEAELERILRDYGEDAYLEACEREGYIEPEHPKRGHEPDTWWEDY